MADLRAKIPGLRRLQKLNYRGGLVCRPAIPAQLAPATSGYADYVRR